MAPPSVYRRQFLRNLGMLGASLPMLPGALPLLAHGAQARTAPEAGSLFGHWTQRDSLPAFVYTADHESMPQALWDPVDRSPTRRHFHVLGNRALQVQVSNTGDVALFDESEGMRWLIYGDDASGSGHCVVTEADGYQWGSAFSQRPADSVPERTISCSGFVINARHQGLGLQRTILCPEGDLPWVLVRVDLSLAPDQAPRQLTLTESWALRPRFLHIFQPEAERDAVAASVKYGFRQTGGRLVADELFEAGSKTIGEPASIMLEALNPGEFEFSAPQTGAGGHPVLEARTSVTLQPGTSTSLWFRVGREVAATVDDPEILYRDSINSLQKRLPVADTVQPSSARREITWHAAMLSGGANRDAVLGGHTLNQSSVYGFGLGGNAAARDPLQHALPLVYSEPDLALSVLRNTCAWGSPDGDLPYGLTGDKQPLLNLLRPSDQNLWVFWLASEYAAVTGDLQSFGQPQSYHPAYGAADVSITEHLVRQFEFFVSGIGRGERNHVKLLNADWNDMVLEDTGLDRETMIAEGSSVLNSAMASWVMSIFAPLMERLGRVDIAHRARDLSTELRQLVAKSWNGKWYDRAYGPGGIVVGRDRCWLEVQPWAILCGAAEPGQAKQLLTTIREGHCADSPLGARVLWPPERHRERLGQGTTGGIWYSINTTLIWAAAKVDPEFAWQQWQAMSLANHTRHFPHLWEGTLSGPDAWNAPEADRPGQTWTTPLFSMQAFPVNNMHSHSQPLLSYLRLLGVAPEADGSLGIKPPGGKPLGSFTSSVLHLQADGHGWLKPLGQVRVKTRRGEAKRNGSRVVF